MALTVKLRGGTVRGWFVPRAAGWSHHRFLESAVLVVAAGAGVLVGRDGSLPWQIVRVVAVVGLALALYVMIDRGDRLLRAGVSFGVGCVSVAI